MAALHYATATHRRFRFTSETLNPRKPILIISSLSTSFPTKPTRRKNHLRKKILKTLEKPIIPKLPPTTPIIPIESPPLQEIEEESDAIQEIEESEKSEKSSEAGNEEVEKLEELRELEVSVQSPDGVSVGMLAKNPILKYGLWLVGAFVFQTICAIWVFGSSDADNKNEILSWSKKSSVLELGGHEEVKSIALDSAVNSSFYVDESEMERKIEEIRVMAREAREKERLESKKNGLDSDGNDGGEYSKSGIEEEVENRLIKLRKKLKNVRDRVPVASIAYSRKGNKRNDDEVEKMDEGESNGALTFKKKYKFKGLSGGDKMEKPKGFIGNKDDTNCNLDTESDEDHVVEEDEKKYVSENNTRNKVAEEGQASKEKVAIIKGIAMKKNNGNIVSLKDKGAGDAKSALKSESETDFWWLNLPYVSVILMQRGNDGEGRKGLYTLKSNSGAEDQTSHMLAFEDRSDATNFCYLLQSFFKDLPDFEADVVPLTIEELREAAKSRAMRVIVVKKGQLRLYAGQPLADAELALRAMVK